MSDILQGREPDAVTLTRIEIRQALLTHLNDLQEAHPGRSPQELLFISFDGQDSVAPDVFLENVFAKTGLGGELDPEQRQKLLQTLTGISSRASNDSMVDLSMFYFQLQRSLSDLDLVEVALELQSWIDEDEEDDDEEEKEEEEEDSDEKEIKQDCAPPAFLKSLAGEGGFLEKLDDLGFDYGLSDDEIERLFKLLQRIVHQGGEITHTLQGALVETEDDTEEPSSVSASDDDVLAELDAPPHLPTAKAAGRRQYTRQSQGQSHSHSHSHSHSNGYRRGDFMTSDGGDAAPTSDSLTKRVRNPFQQKTNPLVPLKHLTVLQTYQLLNSHEDVQGTAAAFRDLQFDGEMLSEVEEEDIDEIVDLHKVAAADRISNPLRAAKAQLLRRVKTWRAQGVDPHLIHFSAGTNWAVSAATENMDVIVDPVHRDILKTLENMLQDIDDLNSYRETIENAMQTIAVHNFTRAEAERNAKHTLTSSFHSPTA